jgi:phosphohistidine phosphatase
MLTLYLVRHAKSSWENSGIDDKLRPLNKRGKHDAPLMGKVLFERSEFPDLIISSPAKRAYLTAKKIALELGYPKIEILKKDQLYMAGIDDFMDVITGVTPDIKRLMVVSHNFGITDFTNQLTGSGISSIPTCGVVRIDLKSSSWADAASIGGELIFFEYPKKY